MPLITSNCAISDGCTWDPRPTTEPNTIVVSDRRNMRFEFFHYDPASYETFEYYKTVDMQPSMGPGTLPCNMRMTHGRPVQSKVSQSFASRSVRRALLMPKFYPGSLCRGGKGA